MGNQIEVGLVGRKAVVGLESMSAVSMGSGSVPDTFSTPALLALMEGAAVNAVDRHLDEGQATVGISAEIKHLAATPIGNQLTAEARVVAIDGRKITFEIDVHDEYELVGSGTHARFIIKIEKFVDRLGQKKGA